LSISGSARRAQGFSGQDTSDHSNARRDTYDPQDVHGCFLINARTGVSPRQGLDRRINWQSNGGTFPDVYA
jgi:hypothetical protein